MAGSRHVSAGSSCFLALIVAVGGLIYAALPAIHDAGGPAVPVASAADASVRSTSSDPNVSIDDYGLGHVYGPNLAVCFAPGTSIEYMEAVSARIYGGQPGP